MTDPMEQKVEGFLTDCEDKPTGFVFAVATGNDGYSADEVVRMVRFLWDGLRAERERADRAEAEGLANVRAMDDLRTAEIGRLQRRVRKAEARVAELEAAARDALEPPYGTYCRWLSTGDSDAAERLDAFDAALRRLRGLLGGDQTERTNDEQT